MHFVVVVFLQFSSNEQTLTTYMTTLPQINKIANMHAELHGEQTETSVIERYSSFHDFNRNVKPMLSVLMHSLNFARKSRNKQSKA